MARSTTITAGKLHDGSILLSRITGILGLGFSVWLEAVVVTPFYPNSRAMVALLMLAAVAQIGAGLNEWRQERILPSVALVAFGLFSCSQISQLGNLSATSGHSFAQGSFLLFWGVFAALLAAQPSDCDGCFHLLLAVTATTLLCKAIVLLFALPMLWPLLLLIGVVAFALSTLTALRYLPGQGS